MPADVAQRKAGQFAKERFNERNRAWLRRIWWALPLAALPVAMAPLAIAAVFYEQHMTFAFGLAVGCGLTIAMCLAMSPPAHIEHWRQGAEGERKTARVLRPLVKGGWVLINDVQRHNGNIDHVLIGPPGVFVLETKNLQGRMSVSGDTLKQSYREDPAGGHVVDRLGTTTRGRAAALHDQLRNDGLRPGWLHAVVVVWGAFEERSVQGHRVTWIHGRELVHHLRSQPVRLIDDDIRQIAEHVSEHG